MDHSPDKRQPKTMQATFEDHKQFSKLIGVISAFENSFILKCSKQGIRIFCLDNSKTSVIEVTLPNEYFKQYSFTAKKTDTIDLGINVPVFMDTLKGMKKTDTLHLISEEGKDLLKVQADGEESQMVYDIKLMTIEENAMEIPDMAYNIRMTLKASVLKMWKSQICDHTGESLQFNVEKDKLLLTSAGTNVSVKSTLCHGESMCITNYDDPSELTLSQRSITTAARICDIASEMQYGWTNAAPANFTCVLGNGGRVSMWFAPTMADDEEDADMNDA
tara:strand:+ start:99 stop:926 length:828 start_codon:yes stop_codon:yes gene_type:complete